MTPIQHLHTLYMAYHRERYPNVPTVAIPKPDYKLTDTNGLTRAIIDFIRFSGGHAERVNTTGRQIKAKSGKQIWITTTATKGSADIHAIINGRSAMIEVKNAATRDRMRPKQEEYARRVAMAGGLYFVARDFDSFYHWFVRLSLCLLLLIGCAPVQELQFVEVYQTGAVFTENDTIINNDTLYYWR